MKIRLLRACLAAVVVCAVCFFGSTANAQKRVNVLRLDGVSIDVEAGAKLAQEKLLRDGDQNTATAIRVKPGEQLDVVFQFGDELVTVDNAKVATKGLAKKSATIEILASTLSPTSGFRVLRSEPLGASRKGGSDSFRFEPLAAKWVIVRVVPVDETMPLSFSIAELELGGYVGAPKSTYLFDESPADAFKVLAGLSGSIDVQLSDEEEKLFADAKDGSLDEVSFAEASLLSSGVTDPQQRKQMLAAIDQLESKCKQQIPESLGAFQRGKKLLELLHAGPMRSGYVEKQTDVSVVLKNQTFNCVSSATLYNIIGQRLGLDVRGIEVPDHAFSILYDGTEHVDIETTNRIGFDPARNRQALDRFQRTTGFVYISDSNRSRRREVGDAGLVALTYYNHGVTAIQEKRHDEAIVSFFKALSLDPGNKSAVKNILATLGNWSRDLFKNGETEKAISVLRSDVIWRRKIETCVTTRKSFGSFTSRNWSQTAKAMMHSAN